MDPEEFMRRTVMDMFKRGDVAAQDLRPLLSEKKLKNRVFQLLSLLGESESIDLLWKEYQENGGKELLEYLTGAFAGVYRPKYRKLLIKYIERAGMRKTVLTST